MDLKAKGGEHWCWAKHGIAICELLKTSCSRPAAAAAAAKGDGNGKTQGRMQHAVQTNLRLCLDPVGKVTHYDDEWR